MLKSFKINNYKNFKNDLLLDFSNISGYKFSNDCITRQLIGKMIIYGKNATGKTNLGRALCDLSYTLNLKDSFSMKRESIKNADSDNQITLFQYTFLFNDNRDEIVYEYSKYNRDILKYEKLMINNQTVYFYDFDEKKFCSYNYDILPKQDILNKYLENTQSKDRKSIPFLSWIVMNAAVDEDSIYGKIYNFAKKSILVYSPNSHIYFKRTISIETLEKNLDSLENFLNEMGVHCHLVIQTLPDGEKELYFKYSQQLVPFLKNASSGTLSLFNFFINFIMIHRSCSLLYFDEFDAFFHHEMAERILLYLKRQFTDSLVILTTHNTNLMTNSLMRPDCLYILSSNGNLTSLNNATNRELREGHNLEKMYISGEFAEYE